MFEENFSVFFNSSEFGEEIYYQPQGGIMRPVSVIFDRQYYEADETTAGISSSSPTILIPENEIPEINYGDKFIRNYETFIARSFEPDGTGLITVILETDY